MPRANFNYFALHYLNLWLTTIVNSASPYRTGCGPEIKGSLWCGHFLQSRHRMPPLPSGSGAWIRISAPNLFPV